MSTQTFSQSAPTESSRNETRLRLREHLQSMSYHAFARLVQHLLYRSGYVGVHLSGRRHARGRTCHGGLDLSARSLTELSQSLTLVQVKQYRRVVSRRFVDELRGAMLRLGASQGLLVTLSKFSAVAREAAQSNLMSPIRLLEGEELLDWLFAQRIGVGLNDGRWQLDEDYLASLEKPAFHDGSVTAQTHAESESELDSARLSAMSTRTVSMTRSAMTPLPFVSPTPPPSLALTPCTP